MGRPRDDIWEYVRERPNNAWECSFCLRTFSGSAARIKAHLSCKTGQGIAGCPNVPDEIKRIASRHDSTNVASTSNPLGCENEIPFTGQDLAPEDTVNRISYSTYELMEQLSKEFKRLICLAEDIEQQLKSLQSQKGKKRKRQVENWLSEVESIKKRIEDIEKLVNQSELADRIELEGKIEQLIAQVAEVIKLKPSEESLVLDVPVVVCTQQPSIMTGKMVGQKFGRNRHKIWELLTNDEVKIIGVHGMGGAGKTTLVSCIHDEISKGVDIFGPVFWVTVTHDFTITELQHDIAKRIGFTLGEEYDERIRAARLRQALDEKKKLVLILDDVWKKIDLNKVGIPIEEGDIQLILTSRSLEVCHRTGCASNDHIIKVEPLSDEEAWQLFLLHLGINETTRTLHPQVIEMARCVAKECGGLPLGIKVLATTMKGVEDIHQWRHALTELQNSTLREQDVEEEIFKVLRFSYDRLNDTKMQKCFLRCSLYPEDFIIDRNELIANFFREGLISGGKRLEEIFDEGQTILDKLVGYSLLEEWWMEDWASYGTRYVKMHDLLRDMACRTGSGRYMVKSGKGLRKIPGLHEWTTDLETVSLMRNYIVEIPEGMSPDCPRLTTLILSDNFPCVVPDCFLVHMPALTALDLSRTGIHTLPNSISDLKYLVSLLLEECLELEYVPPLGKLQALSTLVISNTAIKQPPQDLETLINLKWLNLSCNMYLESQLGSTLSNLISLQYLSVDLPCFKLEVEDLEGMVNLENFMGFFHNDLHFHDFVRTFDKYCGPKHWLLSLEVDDISIHDNNVLRHGRHVELGNNCHDIKHVLPRDIEQLRIRYNYKWDSCLCDVFSFDNASTLTVCEVASCTVLENLFCLSRSCSFCSNLQNLKRLDLRLLASLAVLWKENEQDDTAECLNPPAGGKFSSLTSLSIVGCMRMEKLLTVGMLAHLQNLVKINVAQCWKMKVIFWDPESNEESSGSQGNNSNANDTRVILLPKLEELRLNWLPELKRVCVGIMACDSLREFFIEDCPKLEVSSIILKNQFDRQTRLVLDKI